ncbi:MAG: hypothetical protein CR985_00545 [Flavobacteriales bacterium]|nr:MAG: hypothetical protein CR985_00545 [Flavobacteriales bacterium]
MLAQSNTKVNQNHFINLKFWIMKKIVFTLAAIFSLSLFTPVFASENSNNHYPAKYYRDYGNAITFVEDGVTFSIFQNGEFDFYINPREGLYANIDFGNVSISYNSGYNYDPYVQYDDYGAIIQIENVPIYYDYYGRIIRAGDVRIDYYGRRLHRVGGLRIQYNVHGHYTHCTGFINRYNRHYVYHPFHDFFTIPVYTHTIVSYKPYRKYYTPKRYHYDSGRRYNNPYYKKHRRYKNVSNRIRTNSDKRTVYRRKNTNNKRNSSSLRRSVTRNSRDVKNISRSTANTRKPVKRTTANRNGNRNRRVISGENGRVRQSNRISKVKRTDRKIIKKSPPIRRSNVNSLKKRRMVNRQPTKRQVSKRTTLQRRPAGNFKRRSVSVNRKSTGSKRGNSQRQTATKNRRSRN